MNIDQAAKAAFSSDAPFDVETYKRRVFNALAASQQAQIAEKEAEDRRAAGATKGATRFSTDYAVAYGRRQGWKLLDRERYDYRLKRHFDTLMGSDAMFEHDGQVILVQAAGKSERKEHYGRFCERGGKETAARRGWRFIYMEFERGSKEPAKMEEWA